METDAAAVGLVGRIPIRNIWLLMLYASDLFRQLGRDRIAVEEQPDDIPDLIAELLASSVERRLRRNLSRGYQQTEGILRRVRGRIDVLTTQSQRLLARGAVACRFDELTVDTARNRYVCAALGTIARIVRRGALAHRCRSLSRCLNEQGVSLQRPSLAELNLSQIGYLDHGDRQMLSAARLAFELALPTEESGLQHLTRPDREMVWLRRLFERAVGGFYKVVLEPAGWRVEPGRRLKWQIEAQSEQIERLLPSMITDIWLEQRELGRRLIIDTKFNSILTRGRYDQDTLRSGYVYQIYAYLLSQQRSDDPLSLCCEGMLLHPAIDAEVHECATIQGHRIRFATVDLAASAGEIRERLLAVAISTPKF